MKWMDSVMNHTSGTIGRTVQRNARAAPAQARSTREGNQRARVNGVLRQLDLLVRARPRCAVVLWRPFRGCLP